MAQTSSLPKLLIGGVALGAIAYFMTGTPPPPSKKAASSKAKTSRSSKADEVFTKVDYEAKFPSARLAVKDVFSPLVLASSGGKSGSLTPNAIPYEFTGMKEAWLYTGTAVINGVPNALVENTSTGEGEFIKVGQTWKLSTVRRITPTSLTLTGPGGKVKTMDLMRDLELDDKALMNAQVQPVNPQGGRGPSGSNQWGQPGASGFPGGSPGFPGGSVAVPGASGPGGRSGPGAPTAAAPGMRGDIGSGSPVFEPITSSDNDPAGLGGLSDPAASVGAP